MMHPDETRLNDYVDGVLDDAAAGSVTAHVAQCPACAAEIEQLASLRNALARLPGSIVPDRDLRPGIWSAIDESSVVDIGQARRAALWSARYRLAAAAVILVIVSSAVTVAILRDRDGVSEMARDHARESAILVTRDPQALEREYSDEVRELETILRKSRGALAPETVRIMEQNLKIIDQAIHEARAAISADPHSDMLIDLLRSAYQRKLELLRTAAKSSVMT